MTFQPLEELPLNQTTPCTRHSDWYFIHIKLRTVESLWPLMYRWRSWSSEMEAPWPHYTLGLCLCDYRLSSPQGFHCHWVGFWWSRSGYPFLKGNWASGGEKMGITPGSPCTLLFIHIKGCPRHGQDRQWSTGVVGGAERGPTTSISLEHQVLCQRVHLL